MTKQEWLVEFQVIHGRRPTELEEAAAAIDGYKSTGLSKSGKSAKFRFPKLDGQFFFKTFILLILAVFGYVFGFLFA